MYKIAEPLFFRCITPMHVGCGSDLGIIDLPIQREKHTGYPKIESSGVKGCIREYFEMQVENINDEINVHKLFGYDSDSISKNSAEIKNVFKDDSQYAGAIGFTDSRILLFPVKSIKGVFSWVTCINVLEKLDEELAMTDVNLNLKDFKVDNTKAYCTNKCELITKNAQGQDKFIILEEYQFEASKDNKIDEIAKSLSDFLGIKHLDKKLVVLSDDDFKDFVTMHTEVITRTKIDNKTGAVKDGALFTEEYLPSETIMYNLVLYSPTFYPSKKDHKGLDRLTAKEVKLVFENGFTNNQMILQIGSGSTIGKGLVKITKLAKKNNKK